MAKYFVAVDTERRQKWQGESLFWTDLLPLMGYKLER